MTQENRSGSPNSVKTARTMFETVEFVKEHDGASITEVANELGYAKSTVHRHLSTLAEMGYVTREGDEFRVGLRFLSLGQYARTRHKGYELAKRKVEEITESTGERAQFLVEEHGEAVYLHREFGEHAVRTDPGIGSRIPLHATAAGKAILANLPEERRSAIIEQSAFDPITNHTITDPEELTAGLDVIRDRGFSFNRQENLDGLHAVGAVVTSAEGEVIGALSVSGPTHRLKGERFQEELPDLLLGTANELELNIANN